MSITAEAFFVRFPYLLEHFAVAVAAVSGVLAARGKHVDLFGVLVLALVTAFGGGTVRDLMVGDLPVAWIRDAHFVTTVSAAAVVTFFLARYHYMPRHLLLVADAVGLALFTVTGARKALAFEIAPANAVVLGVITGVAGGMIRDVLAGEIPMVFRPQIYLYATAAILGATIFVIMAKAGFPSQTALLAGACVTLLLRLAAIHWKLRLPVFSERENEIVHQRHAVNLSPQKHVLS